MFDVKKLVLCALGQQYLAFNGFVGFVLQYLFCYVYGMYRNVSWLVGPEVTG